MDRSETYELIIQKADKLFKRFGLMKTPVRDIASELKMSPANVYKYFPTKRAIIEAVMERRMRVLRQEVLERVSQTLGSFDKIRTLMFCFLEYFDKISDNDDSLRLDITLDVLQLETIGPRNSWDFIKNIHGFIESQILSFLKEGIAAGELRAEDPEDTAAALLDCLSRVFEPIILLQDPKPIRIERLERQLRLLKRALS